MKKRNIIIIIGALLLIILAVLLKPKNEVVSGSSQNEEIIKYQTVKAEKISYAEEINTTGILANKDEYQLSFMVGGIIAYLKVNEGERVNKGDILAKINQTSVEAGTERLNLAYEKAMRDYKRSEALFNDKVITLEEFQNAKTGLDNARLQLEDAKFSKTYATIQAPESGIIHKIFIHENEMASAGTPVIIMGAEKKGKVLKTNIADVDVVKIKLKDHCILRFDAFPNKEFKGNISEIAGMADTYTATYEIEIFVEDSERRLKAGLIGSAVIVSGIKKEYVQIPVETLVEADEMQGEVYILNGRKKSLRSVKIQKIVDNKLLVLDGLEGNEQIVVN